MRGYFALIAVAALLSLTAGCKWSVENGPTAEPAPPTDPQSLGGGLGTQGQASSPALEQSGAPEAGDAQMAEAFFDLAKLQSFRDPEMSSADRLAGLVGYLKQELYHPSPPRGLGLGGGPSDTGTVQQVMVRMLAEVVTRQDLAQAYKGEPDPVVRSRLAVAVALAGEPTAPDELVEIMLHDPQGLIRLNAALALENRKDASLKPAFHTALQDKYARIQIMDVGRDNVFKVYPVREEARRALALLGEQPPGTVTEVKRWYASEAEMLSWLLTDKEPQVCLTVVRLLAALDREGTAYLRSFLDENRAEESLKAAVEVAEKALSGQGATG